MTAAAVRIQAGGTLEPARHVYITRPEDAQVLELLLDGQFCNILTSRQMGKSSLMAQAARKLLERGVRVSVVDVAGEIGGEQDQENGYRALLEKIRRDLGLAIDLDQWWEQQPVGTNNQKLLRFFREVVAATAQPTVIFLDEIDATLRLEYTDDLFTALRTIYNERAFEPAYGTLTFCILGVATPNELVKSRRTTAYNIGVTIPLRDFERSQDLSGLARALDPDDETNGDAVLDRILHWTGGQPYLTLYFAQKLAGKSVEDVDRFAQEQYRTLDQVRAENHFEQMLRFLENRLTEGPAAVALLEDVLRGKTVRDRPTLAHTQLKLSGIVKADGQGNLIIRNRIYAQLFDLAWLQTLKPRRTLRRLRWAVAIAAVITIATAFGAYEVARRGKQQIERAALQTIEESSSVGHARMAYEVLMARKPDGEIARQALLAFRNVLAKEDARALSLLSSGRTADACVLAAFNAMHSREPLPEKITQAFNEGYSRLHTTLRASSLEGGLDVSPDGKWIAAGRVVWEINTGREVLRLDSGARINAVAFGGAGELYAGDVTGGIMVVPPGGTRVTPLAFVGEEIVDLAAARSREDALAVVTAETNTLHLFTKTGERLRFEPFPSMVAVSFTGDGRHVVGVGYLALLISLDDFKATRIRLGGAEPWRAVAAGGETLAAASTVRLNLFDLGKRQVTAVVPHKPPLRAVTVSNDGRTVATASESGVRVFRNGVSIWTSPPSVDPAVAVAFVNGGRELLAVKRSDSVELWSDRDEQIPEDASARFKRWEGKFGLTVQNNGQITPLPVTPRTAAAQTPAGG